MKRLVCMAFAALIVFFEWIPAQGQSPQTPLGPPTEMFEATDLAGNPVPARFYLTGGGALARLLGAIFLETPSWSQFGSGAEKDWVGNWLDGYGFSEAWIGYGDSSCDPSFYSVYPWPVNIPGPQAHCWVLGPAALVPGSVSGAVAPLTVTSAGGSLVFHDWEVLDPEPGRCRTGNMGVRAIPDLVNYRGTMETFGEGVEYRARSANEDRSVVAKFRAVYAPASPDVSAPLIMVDTPRDCWEIPHGATAMVSFSCRDLGTGIASCTATPGYETGATIDTSVLGDFSFDVVATDLEGNTRTRTVRYSVVDVTAPTASPSVPPANAAGWYNSDVTVTWNWLDNTDGVGLDPSNCPATSVSSGEGYGVVVQGVCRDKHGNEASASVTVAVDQTPPYAPFPPLEYRVEPNPVVQGGAARAFQFGTSGWGDNLSLASTSCADVVTSAVGSFTVACTAVDKAGNTAVHLLPYTVIAPPPDSTDPTISIVGPVDGATYLRNQAVNAIYSCNDEAGGSGIASCVGTVAPGAAIDTASLGTKTFTVTATDVAGNATSASRSYSVIADYTFGGFAQPVDPAPTVNVGKAGRTYAVEFQLFDLGVPVSDLAAVTGFTYRSTRCDAFNVEAADALETSVTGNTALRYDPTTSAFIYNWKTPSAPGCYALWLTLRTNQQFPAYFQLK